MSSTHYPIIALEKFKGGLITNVSPDSIFMTPQDGVLNVFFGSKGIKYLMADILNPTGEDFMALTDKDTEFKVWLQVSSGGIELIEATEPDVFDISNRPTKFTAKVKTDTIRTSWPWHPPVHYR